MRKKLHINKQFTELDGFINELAETGVPADATIIYKARNRVYTISRGGYELNIKAFRCPKFPNNVIYGTLRESKARRSMENAERLISMGFNTPTPVAYIETREHGCLRESYYVSLQLKSDNLRDWTEKPDCEALLSAFAAETYRLHSAGVYHKDFSPGNVLYTSDGGTYKFYLIDLNRMQFGVKSHAKLMHNFKCINIESADETAHFARLYAAAAHCDAAAMEATAREELRKYLKRKETLHKIKKILK
jgi:tRNA A-37 threonylcarbamoyl transferase component Bud32